MRLNFLPSGPLVDAQTGQVVFPGTWVRGGYSLIFDRFGRYLGVRDDSYKILRHERHMIGQHGRIIAMDVEGHVFSIPTFLHMFGLFEVINT